MQCTVHWTGALGNTQSSMGFMAETGSGHIIAMDGAPNAEQPTLGGANMAARPLELLLAGLGGCASYDVVLILQRGRHQVQGCSVRIQAQRAETDPKVFTHIHMEFEVRGHQLSTTAVERAVALSHEKYCSASIMLGKTATLTTSVKVMDTSAS